MKKQVGTIGTQVKKLFNPEQHKYIVLSDITLSTQLKTYEKMKILFPDIEISDDDIVSLDLPYWTFEISCSELNKYRESDVFGDVDFHVSTFNEFIKLVKSSIVLKEQTIVGDYTAEVYVDRVQVGCQNVSRQELEKVLEIMNKLKSKQ